MIVLIKNQQKLKRLNRIKIKKAALKILSLLEQPAAELSILFVGDKKMLQLNSSFRGMSRSTDVLSFPQIETRGSSEFPDTQTSSLVLGDVVINTKIAAAQAVESGISLHDEIDRLLVHGILHLIGYDHEDSRYRASNMRKKEKELLNALKKMG